MKNSAIVPIDIVSDVAIINAFSRFLPFLANFGCFLIIKYMNLMDTMHTLITPTNHSGMKM